jgi:outer membrane protein
MKKLLFTALIACFAFMNVNAQDTEPAKNDADFNKWQARFRIISVIPSPGDDFTGGDVDISTAFVPELDFTYFFTKNIAAELILGTAKHNVDLEPAVGDDVDLGHVWLLPPTLNLQYHFYAGDFKPYVGAGINYTFFYGVDEGDVLDMDYDNSFGFSFQAGIDYNLNDKWFLNFDIKKILLKTDVDVKVAADTTVPVEVDIDPLIIGLGVGMKF